MDLVDEEDVAILEIGEQGGEIARFGDHRPGRGAEADAELARDDLRQRGLAEPRRPEEEDMVERVAAALGRLDEHAQILARRLLPDELVERLRAQRGVEILGPALGRGEAVGVGHRAAFLSAVRTQERQGSRPGPTSRFRLGRPRRRLRTGGSRDWRGRRARPGRGLPLGAAGPPGPSAMLPALSFSSWTMRWASLGPTPWARAIIAVSPLATARWTLVDRERREDGERDPGADALDRGQQAEPVALGGGGEADQPDRILGDQHLGVQHDLLADRAERGEGAARGGDEIADAVDVDHREWIGAAKLMSSIGPPRSSGDQCARASRQREERQATRRAVAR